MSHFIIDLSIILYLFSLTIILFYSSQGFIMLYYKKKYSNKSFPTNENIEPFPKVTIQLPIYNEKFIVKRLINSICELDYPTEKLEIQVLDDSTDETTELTRKIVEEKKNLGIDIVLLHRTNRNGFKAGALAEGILKSSGEFIAIFDADFIPKNDFLKNTLRYFTSDKIGMVQSRWEYLNEKESLLTKVQAYGLNGHFVIEQKIRNNSGFFINFNGTAGVLRRECIEDAGGWQGDTITEDLDLSYRAQLKGWKFIYLLDYSTPSELPIEINSLKAQQFRWTKGAIETAKKLLLDIWKSSYKIKLKLQATFHLTNNLVFPFILLVGILNLPMIFIKATGSYNSLFNWLSIFIIALLSSFLLYYNAQTKSKLTSISKVMFFPLFLAASMGLSVNNTKAVFEGLINLKSDFVRTPKYTISNRLHSNIGSLYLSKNDNLVLTSEIILAFYSLTGVYFTIVYLDIGAFFFNFLFFIGFGIVSVLSLRNRYLKRNILTND